MDPTAATPDDFRARLERLRSAGALRYDLAETEPAWPIAGVDGARSQADVAAGPALPRSELLAGARLAVAGYLAGHRASARPEHVFLAPSRAAARQLALAAVAERGDDVLVPVPGRTFVAPEADSPRLVPYRLEFGEEWHLDPRAISRAWTPASRAIVVGNPAEPTGAMLTSRGLAALEDLCVSSGLALVGDEALLDTATGASVSVARTGRILALHVSGTGAFSEPGGVRAGWVALAGPDALVAQAAARLSAWVDAPGVADADLRAIPATLAGREAHLQALRTRLARNRGAIAGASLREAPWSLLWGGGGAWAVLQINPLREDRELCLALLAAGVAILPGSLDGFPPRGNVVVSLLTEPAVLLAGLDRLERHLRAPGADR